MKLFRIFLVTLIFVLVGVASYSQPGDPGGDPDVPLGGIELLIAAGAAFGGKKWLNRNKKN
jgi:hypothetical protein